MKFDPTINLEVIFTLISLCLAIFLAWDKLKKADINHPIIFSIFAILLLFLPAFMLFRLAILLAFRLEDEVPAIIDRAVQIAGLLGLFWGILWFKTYTKLVSWFDNRSKSHD